jgi:hypothetical protein
MQHKVLLTQSSACITLYQSYGNNERCLQLSSTQLLHRILHSAVSANRAALLGQQKQAHYIQQATAKNAQYRSTVLHSVQHICLNCYVECSAIQQDALNADAIADHRCSSTTAYDTSRCYAQCITRSYF